MFTKKKWDKSYPEESQCLENDTSCSFDVEYVCHDCGKPLCHSCAVGIAHQPQLVRYRRAKRGDRVKLQWHCRDEDCLRPHFIDNQRIMMGAGGIILGLLLFRFTGGSPWLFAVLALIGLLGGAGLIYNEFRLKNPVGDSIDWKDMWPELPV